MELMGCSVLSPLLAPASFFIFFLGGILVGIGAAELRFRCGGR